MLPGLTDSQLQKYATPESYGRGRDYYRSGAVVSVVERGSEIQATVEGSSYDAYRVRIAFDAGGITEATCSCPYEWGGWCKHIVAVLLTCLHDPEAVEQRPPLDELLRNLNREQLIDLVRDLAAADPDLTARIELGSLRRAGESEPGRQTSIDGRAVRQRVRALLHAFDSMRPSEAYWHVGGVVDSVRDELDQARAFTEAGDGRNALRYLDALTEAYAGGWTDLDDSDGLAGALFEEFGVAWAEALLTADLSADERASWAERLETWQDEIDAYGLDEAFGVAITAAEQGWEDPYVRRVVEEGVITERGAWPGEPPLYADELALARLSVLARQGRYDAYLRLAEAEGQIEAYLLMLVHVGRIEDAVEQGMRVVDTVEAAYKLARALREQGALEDALRVGERGLALDGYGKASLASWVSDLAAGMGRPERALEAALVAFHTLPALDIYRQVQALAGPDWPSHRDELLKHLRSPSTRAEASVDVFLDEGLMEDAIAAVDRQAPYYSHTLVRRVVEAAADTHPEWVLAAARRQAEPILQEGRADLYHDAVDWLVHVRNAYERLDRSDEWGAYLAALKQQHSRKYKLMGLLKARFR